MNDFWEFLWDCIKGLFRGIFWLGTLLFEFLPWLWNGSEEDDETWKGRFIRLLMTLAGGRPDRLLSLSFKLGSTAETFRS